MKRGQSVRILRTNQIGTIADVELIRKGGKVYKYCHVKTDAKPDLWLDSSELGDIVERARITFSGDNGQEIYIDMEWNHKTDVTTIKITGKPENLLEHKQDSFNSRLAAQYLRSLKECQVNDVGLII